MSDSVHVAVHGNEAAVQFAGGDEQQSVADSRSWEQGAHHASATYVPARTGYIAKLERTLFSVLHLMKKEQKVTTTITITALVLTLLDFLQLLSLILDPRYGWPVEQFAWIRQISIMNLVFPDRNNVDMFLGGYTTVTLVSWVTVCLSIYVGHSVTKNTFKHIWPLKLLRILVHVLLTAGMAQQCG